MPSAKQNTGMVSKMELKEVAEREKILLEQHLEQLKKRIRETKNHMDRIVNDIENSVQPITHKLNDEFLIALPDAKLYVSQVQNILSSLEGIMSKYSIQSNKVAKVPGGPVAFTPVLREKLPCDENKSLKKSFTSKTEERNVAPSSGLKMYESETKLANKRCKVRSNKSTSIVGGAEEELLENKISTQAEMYHISSQGVHEHEFYNEGRIPKVLAENNVYRSLETDFTDVFASQQCRDADALKGDLDILRPKLCACSNPGILPLKQPTHVIISLIKLPNLAWIQRSDCELPKLNEHLGFLLSTNNYTPYGNLYVGMKVAALYKPNRAYYRAIITGLADETSKVFVYFVDYGNIEMVKRKHICWLPHEMSAIPDKAFACIVSHVDDHALYAKDIPDPVFTSLQNYVYEGTILLAVIEKLPVPQSDSQYLRPLEYTARLYTPQYRLYRSEVEVHPYYWLYTSELGTGLQSDTSSDDVIEDVEILDEVLSEQSSSQGENNCTTEKQGSWTLLTENLKHCDCGHWTRLLMPANQKAERKYAVDSSRQVTRSKKNIEACFKDITCNSKSTTIDLSLDASKNSSSLDALPDIHPKLPQIEIKGAFHDVRVSFVFNVQHFYLQLGNKGNNIFERFQHCMQEHYAKSSKSLKVKGGFPVGSYWAVRDDSGTWYRGMIIPRGEVSCGQMNKCDNAREKVKVRYVDCGREETVDIKQIRRLHKDFRKMQILALRCSLHQVYPKSKWMVDPWAKASTDAFLEKCGGLMATLKAHFVLRNQLTEMYEVELHSEEGININKFMVKTGFAVLRLQNRERRDNADGSTSSVQHFLQPGWNPMAEDYLDTENRYLDNECAEMVLSGIKNTDETRVCKLYCSGKVCHYGETCRYEHTRPRDALCDEDDSDSLEKLSVAMLEYYRYSAPEHSATLPAIGEIKALCEIVDGELTFSRVRVLNVYNKNRGTLIEVFFIDNGNTSWVKEEQLRPFAPQFAHAPPQAIQCYLEGLDKPKKGWNAYSAEQLLQLTEGVTLVAEIMNVDSIEDRLGVVLYNTGGYEDININEALWCILKL